MEERKGKRIRSSEDPPRSSDKRRKTRKKEDENVLSRRGSSSSEGRRRGRDMSSPDKDESEGTRKYAGLTCHQCKIMMSSKTDLVFCSICINKRYCKDCITRWYPERTPEGVKAACPFCMGNCNCRACLREPLAVKIRSEKDENVKLKQLQYLLVKVLPVLRAIYTEQNNELEIETAIRGVPVTESDVAKCEVHPSVRIYCIYSRMRGRPMFVTLVGLTLQVKIDQLWFVCPGDLINSGDVNMEDDNTRGLIEINMAVDRTYSTFQSTPRLLPLTPSDAFCVVGV